MISVFAVNMLAALKFGSRSKKSTSKDFLATRECEYTSYLMMFDFITSFRDFIFSRVLLKLRDSNTTTTKFIL